MIASRLDEHVRKNRNGVLALDDALEQLELAEQIVLADDKFHSVMTSLLGRAGRFDLFRRREILETRNYNSNKVLWKSQ